MNHHVVLSLILVTGCWSKGNYYWYLC